MNTPCVRYSGHIDIPADTHLGGVMWTANLLWPLRCAYTWSVSIKVLVFRFIVVSIVCDTPPKSIRL